MGQLVRLQDIQATQHEILGSNYYSPIDKTAYGIEQEKIGKVDDALVDADAGRVRYLVVDVGGWFASKQVLVPAGLARIEGDEVYFDSLTKAQVEAMESYDSDYIYTYEEQYSKDQQAFSGANIPAEQRFDVQETHYNAPNTLELLEERLSVNKDRIVAGVASISKRVVSEEKRVDVELAEERAHIERTAVNRPTDRRIGDDSDVASVSIELEAERAHVDKQTYVTEEVSLDKTSHTHTKTIQETIQKEELSVDDQGNVLNAKGDVVNIDGITADDVRRVRGLS